MSRQYNQSDSEIKHDQIGVAVDLHIFTWKDNCVVSFQRLTNFTYCYGTLSCFGMLTESEFILVFASEAALPESATDLPRKLRRMLSMKQLKWEETFPVPMLYVLRNVEYSINWVNC